MERSSNRSIQLPSYPITQLPNSLDLVRHVCERALAMHRMAAPARRADAPLGHRNALVALGLCRRVQLRRAFQSVLGQLDGIVGFLPLPERVRHRERGLI